jgi:hypothetical protein
VAETLKEELGLEAELISGARGEFTVRVGGEVVIGKTADEFPSPSDCVNAVREHLNT